MQRISVTLKNEIEFNITVLIISKVKVLTVSKLLNKIILILKNILELIAKWIKLQKEVALYLQYFQLRQVLLICSKLCN